MDEFIRILNDINNNTNIENKDCSRNIELNQLYPNLASLCYQNLVNIDGENNLEAIKTIEEKCGVKVNLDVSIDRWLTGEIVTNKGTYVY